jgi:CHAT domain-containing protein
LSDTQKTFEFAQQGLVVARQINNKLVEVRALSFLGDASASLEDNQKAIEFAQQALALARELKNIQLEGLNLGTLGRAYSSLGDNVKGLELAQQSLVIAQQIKKPELECRALFVLVMVYAKDDLQKSINSIQKCLAISQELKNPQLESSSLSVLSVLYFALGEYQKSTELNQQGLAINQKIKNMKFEVILQMLQSMTYLYQKDSQKAIDSAQQLLIVAQVNKSRELETLALSLMAAGYSDLGDYQRALALSEKGLAIAREQPGRSGENFPLAVLADIYSKIGRKKEALVIYRDLVSTDSNNLASQVSLARAYRDSNLPFTAITYYKEAVNKIEKYRLSLRGMSIELQESFLKKAVFGYVDKLKRADTYRELADLLLSQGRILEAQQVLELLKTQELRDFTGNMRAGGKKPEISFNQTEEQIKKENGTLIAFGQRLYECQQTQCKQLSQLLDQRQTLTEQYNQKIQTIEKEIRERRAKDDAFFDPNKLNKAKEIVEAQPGTLLLYPLVLPDKIWLLWTAQGGIVKSVEVPNVGQKQIGETVLKFRQLLQNPNSDITQLKATSKQLYDWLIKPIEPELKQNRIQNLVFSLDRATRYIPMSALFDGEKYLVENYAVSLVLSADLTDTKDRLPPGTQNTPVLALGLSKAVAGYNALPNVPAELNAIVRKKTNDTTGIYPGLEFLNETFDFRALRDNLIGRKILHVATHGQFVPGRQEDSYLLLGKGEKLTITQIKTLQDLSNIHLVVLSACETALGEPNQDGIEINGISFSFLNAGAKAVMASLWLVNDASTSKLMEHFYSNLAQDTKPITKAAALRQAQLSLLRGESSKTETTDQTSSPRS